MDLTGTLATHLAAAVLAAAAAWGVQGWRLGAHLTALRAEVAAAEAAAQQQARADESRFQTRLTEARDAASHRESALRAELGRSRDALDILRHTALALRADLSGDSATPGAERAAAAAELLADCARDYRGVAAAADRHAADAVMLREAWPR